MTHYRPLVIQCCLGKAFLRWTAQQVLSKVRHLLYCHPQFAYLAGRDAEMAIFRAQVFLQERRHTAGYVKVPASWQRAGWKAHDCCGCILVSLDLSNAFDKVNRALLLSKLASMGLPSELLGVIGAWYLNPSYELKIGDLYRTVHTTRGVRQGCTLAPLLWVCYLYCLIEDLRMARPGVDWLSLLTAYADDLLLSFAIDTEGDVKTACDNIVFFFDFLKVYGLEVNLSKTQVLCRLIGKSSQRAMSKLVRPHEGGRRFKASSELFLPLTDEIEYLGVSLSWKNGPDSVLQLRVMRGRRAFAMLHQWWRMPLSLALKVRLFHTMILPVYLYGLSAVGLSPKGILTLRKDIMRCLRRIARSPVHITRESDLHLLDRLHAQNPVLRVQVSCCQLLRRMLVTLPVEVCPSSSLEHDLHTHKQLSTPWWDTLVQGLNSLFPKLSSDMECDFIWSLLLTVPKHKLKYVFAEAPIPELRSSHKPSDGAFVCDGCNKTFGTYNLLRTHQYKQQCAWTRTLATYEPAIDNDSQDPSCAWCKRSFLWWSGLRLHIERGHCPHMSRRDDYLRDLSGRNAPQPAMHHSKDLSCHCVLCGRWIKLARSLSSHLSRAHPKEVARAKLRYKAADLSSLKCRQRCPFCKLAIMDTSNLRAHVRSHCLVLLQRFIAGFPFPLDPDHPGCPSSEQTCPAAGGHGEVGRAVSLVPTSECRIASSLGRTLPSHQESKVRRRLRGKQRDPRCRDEGGLLRQQHAKANPEVPEQAASTSDQGTESGQATTGRELSQELGQAGLTATGNHPMSYPRMRLSSPHGSRRSTWNGAKPCGGEQSMEICNGRGISGKGVIEGPLAEDDHGHTCSTPGRAQSPEGWRSPLRLRAERLAAVLRAGLGCSTISLDSSCRRQDTHPRGTDEAPRSHVTSHTCGGAGETQGTEATADYLPQYGAAGPCCDESSDTVRHADVGAVSHVGEHVLLGPPGLDSSARQRQAQLLGHPSNAAGISPAIIDLTLSELLRKFACLLNPNAIQCYMNAFYFALQGILLHYPTLIAEWDHRLALAITSVPLRPARVDLAKVSTWQHLLDNWPIVRQEDVGEFILYLFTKFDPSFFRGFMAMKRPGYDDEQQEFLLLTIPVPDVRERSTLSSLLQQWANPGDDHGHRQWLTHPPKVLLLQLMRFSFCVQTGVVSKIRSPIVLDSRIEIYVADPELHPGRVCTYHVCSAILHSGATPAVGHYTTFCSLAAGRGVLLNDAAIPRALTASDAFSTCSKDMYVVCLVLQE